MDNATDGTYMMGVTDTLGIQNEDRIMSLAATYLVYKIGKDGRFALLLQKRF